MKIPTAKEFYDKHYSDDCVVIMRDFAKLHVEAALKAASEDAQVIQQGEYYTYFDDPAGDVEVAKDTILDAYPPNMIK